MMDWRRIALAVTVGLGLVLFLFGCSGDKPKKVTERQPAAVSQEQLRAFVTTLSGVINKEAEGYQKLTDSIKALGYGKTTPAQTKQEAEKLLALNQQLRQELDDLQTTTREMEEAEGNIATCIYLRNQVVEKFVQRLAKSPAPKTSELNGVLKELRESESFAEAASGKLAVLKQQAGME